GGDKRTPAVSARPGRNRGFWFSDFHIARGRVKVFDTGADLSLDRTLAGEAVIWFGYHLVVRIRSWWMALTRRERPSIWFAPQRPRPWYLVWSAMAWSGLQIANSPETAEAIFAFEDSTWTAACLAGAPAFNGRCADVSKSRVAEVFEAVFGYPLALDPQTWSGPAVEKAEVNGAHDGRVIACPAPRLPGRHYQRLVDTRDGAFTYDLRTPCVGGRPVAVWIKRKPQHARFSIHNLSVALRTPQEVFSAAELAQIERFLETMGVDWAGLDILRDRTSGRIYIVDVNKTDVGPIIALSFADKLRSTALLARALESMVAPQAGAGH
ncbi:MAG: hypothetical protein ABW360_16600, partial [Phenylobacterium sp.]